MSDSSSTAASDAGLASSEAPAAASTTATSELAASAPSVEVSLLAAPALHLAMERSGVPLVRDALVRNLGARPLEGASLELALAPSDASPARFPVPVVPPGEAVSLGALAVRAAEGRPGGGGGGEPARLAWTLRDAEGAAIASGERPLALLALEEWPGARASAALLAAFVTPDHAVTARIVARAQEAFAASQAEGEGAFDGYRSRSIARVRAMISALHGTVRALGVEEEALAPGWHEAGRRVRFPDDVLRERRASPLDLAALCAGCLERMGLSALLVLLEGRVLPGAWLVEERFPEGIVEDAARLRNMIALGEIVVFEQQGALEGAHAFPEARLAAEEALALEERFLHALDVRVLRGDRVAPLPVALRTPASREEATHPLLEEAARDPAPAPLASVRGAEEGAGASFATGTITTTTTTTSAKGADASTARRFRHWQEKLLDLSLRNRLLHVALSGKGVIPLEVPDVALFEDLLAAGKGFDLLARPVAVEGEEAKGLEPARDRAFEEERRQKRLEDLRRGVAHSPLAAADLWARARRLASQARTDLEEGGATTLHVAVGFLRWFETEESETERTAPLLLYPAELVFDRKKRRARLARIAEDDPVANVTLIEKMRRDFDVDLSALERLDEDSSGLDVGALLQGARRAIARMPRWEVKDEAHVGLFTFTKFLMWKDLDENAALLLENEVVRHIAAVEDRSFAAQGSPIPPERLDDELPPAALPLVLDADSTQVSAVQAAIAGRSFVLQGPPGTGKSQTITNMIAAALAAQKTVLFVSEKMAALDVVHRRLEASGLGDFCLELHSHKSNKKQVLESFRRAAERTERQGKVAWEERSKDLAALRASLNAYVRALHARRPSGHSFYEASARLLELRLAPEVRFKSEQAERADEAAWAAQREAVAACAERAAAVDPAAQHPFAPCDRQGWTAAADEALADALDGAEKALEEAEAAGARLCEAMRAPLPERTEALAALCALGRAVGLGPVPEAAILGSASASGWSAASARASAYLGRESKARARRADLLERRKESFILEVDHASEIDRFRRWIASFLLVRLVMLFFARRALGAHSRGGSAGPSDDLLLDLEKAHVHRGEAPALAKEREAVAALLAGAVDDAGDLEAAASALERGALARDAAARLASLGGAPAEALGALAGKRLAEEDRAAIAGAAEACAARLDALAAAEKALLDAAGAPEGAAWPKRDDPRHRPALRERIALWRTHAKRFRPWCLYRQEAAKLRALGLAPLDEAHRAGKLAAGSLEAAHERWFLSRLCATVRDAEPALRDFEGGAHHKLVDRFGKRDEEHMDLARRAVAARLEDRLPKVAQGGAYSETSEVGVLLRELKKKTRHMAVRKLLQAIPNLLPRLKPCLLMSPLSVAQYLPAGGEPSAGGDRGGASSPRARAFDLVVFDEASQIGTHDAIGAIARGKQVVIVGDSRQLPPTTFFVRTLADEDAAADENDVVELESILDEAIAKQIPQQSLGWHYRSRHESLIEFSNRSYYEGRLDVFPAARAAAAELGVEWHPVPGGVFYSGEEGPRARTNPLEAQALVKHLVAALRRTPPGARTFGVVTFNQPQQEHVRDLLDEARARHPEIEAHFVSEEPSAGGGGGGVSPPRREPVFVKNLENVQGDERDEVLFSIGYARDQHGKLRIAFGPLSTAGGERRLNVAITRAREKLRVFSTLTHDQIDLSRSSAVGTAHLRRFLEYVASRGAAPAAPEEGDAPAKAEERLPSRFEREILEAVRALGKDARTAVGCGGYRIDVAVVHPERPGEFILGIECDGPSYRGARTARDRDRLRRKVLESLGWSLARVWSQDWLADPEGEKARLAKAIAAALRAHEERREAAEAKAAALAAGAAAGDEEAKDAAPAGEEEEGAPEEEAPATARPARKGRARAEKPGRERGERAGDSADRAAERQAEGAAEEPAEGAAEEPAERPAKAAPKAAASEPDPSTQPYAVADVPPAVARTTTTAPATPEDFHLPSARKAIRDRIALVVDVEGPIHEDLCMKRVLAAWGIERVTSRPRARLEEEIEALAEAARLVRRGDFLWRPGDDPAAHARFRGAAPDGGVRDPEHLPAEEVAAALARVLAANLSLERADLAREAARLLGFTRAGKAMAERIEAGLALLAARAVVEAEGERLHWRGKS